MTGTDSADLPKVIPAGAGTYQGERVRGPQLVNPDGTLQPINYDGTSRSEASAVREHLTDRRFTPQQTLVADVLGIDLWDLYDEDGSPMESEPEAMARVNRMVSLVEGGRPLTPEELQAVSLYDHVNGLLSLNMGRFPDDSPVQDILAADLTAATTELNTALSGILSSEMNSSEAAPVASQTTTMAA